MKWESSITKTETGLEITSYAHEVDMSLALEELEVECLQKNKKITLQKIESMIKEGYNLDFLYYDFDFETNTRTLE
jgi:hypothetical protein